MLFKVVSQFYLELEVQARGLLLPPFEMVPASRCAPLINDNLHGARLKQRRKAGRFAYIEGLLLVDLSPFSKDLRAGAEPAFLSSLYKVATPL